MACICVHTHMYRGMCAGQKTTYKSLSCFFYCENPRGGTQVVRFNCCPPLPAEPSL